MPYRILHVISSVNPQGGGPIEGLSQLAAVNRRHGHQVEILSLDDPHEPFVRQCPVPCHAMGPTRMRGYRYTPRLTEWLKAHRHDYDLVIINGIWQYHAFGAWRALRGTGTPYFVFIHGMLDPWFKRNYPFKHLKKWLFWPWAEYRVLRDATSVMFTCEDERRLARQSFWLYRCREFVVNYGTSAPPTDADAQRTAFASRFPNLTATRNLLFLGRVHEKKGADLLLRAFADVLRDDPARLKDVRLVMAGPADHPYGQRMQALAQELGLAQHVFWTGMLRGELKWGAFRAADAFILPSHQENFGIAVAEALACGVPVLISNQVNIWREIDASGAGLVEPDDLAGTRRLIERWLDQPQAAWQAMKTRATQCFHERFLIDRTFESVMAAMALHGIQERPARPALSEELVGAE